MKLKDIANIKVGLPLVRKKGALYDDIFFEYKMVTLKSFSKDGTLLKNELDTFISKEKLKDKYLTKKGDILIRLREPYIAVSIDNELDNLLVPAFIAIISPKIKLNSNYLSYYINSNYIQHKLQKLTKGTTINMIKAKDLGEIEIFLPPLQKQNKIVSLMQLANKEIKLLKDLADKKEKLKNQILDTIIKEAKQ